MANPSPGAPPLPSVLTALTQADLLAIIERLLPSHYVEPLKNTGPGYEILQAYAAVFARVSQAIQNDTNGLFILIATQGSKAKATVAFSRANANAGAVTVKAGTVVRTSASGRNYLTDEDVVFGATDVGPFETGVTAELEGYTYNVPGPKTTADGTNIPGAIDTVKLPVQDPVFGDPSITVAQVTDAAGGVSPFLDSLGEDRGMPRLPAEPDTAYRVRIRSLLDTISPAAIRRNVAAWFDRYPLVGWDIVETWDLRYQTCWDAPDAPIAMNPLFDPTLFVYDDPRSGSFRDRWMDDDDQDGAFIVVVPDTGIVGELGMVYDDPAILPADLESPLGERAAPAYDTPDVTLEVEQGAYDGEDYAAAAFYAGLWALLQEIKAAGVSASIELATE